MFTLYATTLGEFICYGKYPTKTEALRSLRELVQISKFNESSGEVWVEDSDCEIIKSVGMSEGKLWRQKCR